MDITIRTTLERKKIDEYKYEYFIENFDGN
jgi:hypothetical protein